MPRKSGKGTSAVISGVLYTDDENTGLRIGSAQWFTWLETATTFYYDNPDQSFTARLEKQRNTFYWFGYHRTAGHLHKVYIGLANTLTADKLADTALRLAERANQVKVTRSNS